MKQFCSAMILAAGCALTGGAFAAAPQPLQLTSSSFEDGGMLPRQFAGQDAANASCVGDNLSPAFAWSGAPAGTKSFALLALDPEARGGLGVSHFVGYGIPSTTTAVPEGALAKGDGFVGGKGSINGNAAYFGPCPPVGVGVHHYTFTLIATDLEPQALPAGLTRDQLLQRLDGHALAASVLIGRFGHP